MSINGREQTPCEIKKNEALEYNRPTSIKELGRFLGLTGWFRSFIKDYGKLTVHLTEGLKGTRGRNKLVWNEKMEAELKGLKDSLRNMKELRVPDYKREFMLRTDGRDTGLGAVLVEEDENGEWVPSQWASKKLTPTERRYGISEKEMYGVLWGIKKFEYELRGRRFKLETDRKALEEIRRKGVFKNNRINRWIEKIQEYGV